jgi:hypothetical protein
MELDQYRSSDLEDMQTTFVEYRAPVNAKFYRSLPVRGSQPSLVPIQNIILSDFAEITLHRLRQSFGTKYFVTQSRVPNPTDFSKSFFALFNKFETKQTLPPVKVREKSLIGKPSQSDPSSISVLGQGSAYAQNLPILTDYIYQILSGDDLVSLSIFFGYDHLPVVVDF